MEPIINGMLNQNPESGDVNMVSDITQSLFANQNFPGSDLIARNIHRGRDHGLPAYNEYRYEMFLFKLVIPSFRINYYCNYLHGHITFI